MANFTDQEKQVLSQALSTFIQVASQQFPREQVEELAAMAETIMKKAEQGTDSTEESMSGGRKPKGIGDEFFENVCKSCDKYDPSGNCLDPVTEKYPEKCDPILEYKRNKAMSESRNGD
ncbi:MAG: hypothetical protein ACLFQK_10095 [Fibrobacterota bacterium]